jgi:hypothetical protein
MTNQILTDSLLRFDQMKVEYVADKDIVRSASGIITFQTNTSARRVIRCRLIASTATEKEYLRGVVQAAYYSNDSIEFTLPPEAQKYSGDYTANDLESTSVKAAGSNNVTVRVGSTGNTHPSSSAFVQGERVSFGSTHQSYIINSYSNLSGVLTFHPVLRTEVANGDSVNYNNPKFRGYITSSNISEELFQGNSDAMRMTLMIEEAMV